MSCGIGMGRIGGKEFRLAKAGRYRSVFDATELFDGETRGGGRQGVSNALKGGLETVMGQQDGGNHVERGGGGRHEGGGGGDRT